MRRLDVIATGPIPLEDEYGPPAELDEYVQILIEQGKPVQPRFIELTNAWRRNNDMEPRDPALIASGAEFHLKGTAHDHDQSSHGSGAPDVDYHGGHRPTDTGPRVHDLWESVATDGLDVYENPQFFTGYSGAELAETMRQLRAARGNPDAPITIYRAAPNGAEIREGDWVTLSERYARTHLDSGNAGDDAVILQREVTAKEVRWAVDDLMEYGWFPSAADEHHRDFAVQFHLRGTAHDHDQSSHGGGGGSRTVDSPDDAIGHLRAGKATTVTADDAITVVEQIGADDAGPVDLTNMTIDGFPLFEPAKDGLRKRADMPQVPEAQIDNFQVHLEQAGIAVTPGVADPTVLRSTQNELDATKVGQMVAKIRAGTFHLGHPPWVSSDGYILDGHHRWAAFAILEAAGQPHPPMDVFLVDMPITELLAAADRFNELFDVKSKTIHMAVFLATLGYGVEQFVPRETEQLHLKGTANDHDQSSHGGGGGGGGGALADVDLDSLDGEHVEAVSTADVASRFDLYDGDREYATTDGGRLYRAPDDRYVALLDDDGGVYVDVVADLYEAEDRLDLDDLESEITETWREDVVRGPVYHGTTDENAAAILAAGMERRNQTRGLNNRWVGSSVFTTSDPELAAQYGTVIEVDLPAAIADGAITPLDLSREPGFDRADAMMSVAHSFEDHNYDPYSQYIGSGEDPNTVIIGAEIPARYLKRYDDDSEFHLKGTANDHDQQSHAGGGAADPGIRSDGVAFEHEDVTALADQYVSNSKVIAQFKHEGAARVASYMGAEERQAIADELNKISTADMPPGIGAAMENGLDRTSDFGLDASELPLGVAMQAASLASAWRLDMPGYETTERLSQAVDAFKAGGDAAALSAVIDELGISVAHGAVDWRNAQWQTSAVWPGMVAFHLAAADSYRLSEAKQALRGYYPSGSYEAAESIRRYMPDTIDSILAADRFAIEDTLQMTVRRDNRDTVTVYRGVKNTGHSATNYEGADTVTSNPLSSWSVDRGMARQFAGEHSTDGGWLIEAEVPVDQIIAMSTVNGWGSLQEREVILMGRPTPIRKLTPINREGR